MACSRQCRAAPLPCRADGLDTSRIVHTVRKGRSAGREAFSALYDMGRLHSTGKARTAQATRAQCRRPAHWGPASGCMPVSQLPQCRQLE